MAPRLDLLPVCALWVSGWPDTRGDHGTAEGGDRMTAGMFQRTDTPHYCAGLIHVPLSYVLGFSAHTTTSWSMKTPASRLACTRRKKLRCRWRSSRPSNVNCASRAV